MGKRGPYKKREVFVQDADVQLKARAALQFCKENGCAYSFWTEKELGIVQGA